MSKFMDWLSEEARGVLGVGGFVLLAAIFNVAFQEMVRAATCNWGLVPYPTKYESPFAYMNTLLFADLILLGPIKEEVIFRIVPLSLVIWFFRFSPRALFGVVVAFAVLFGSIHPYGWLGNIGVAIAGVFFGIVFLRCGGLNKAFLKAAAATVAAHGLSNLLITLSSWYEYLEMAH